jgi:hypothetical protein
MYGFLPVTHILLGMLARTHLCFHELIHAEKGPACAELCIWSPQSWHPAWRQNCRPRTQLVGPFVRIMPMVPHFVKSHDRR